MGAVVGSFFVGLVTGCAVGAFVPEALRTLAASPLHGVLGLLATAAWAKALPAAALGALLWSVRALRGWLGLLAAGGAVFSVEWFVSTWHWGVPWSLLGHSQVFALGAAQLALVGGVPLVSSQLAAVGWAAWSALRDRDRDSVALAASLLAGWLAALVFGLPLAETIRPAAGEQASDVALLVIQPNVPRGERWAKDLQASILRRTVAFTATALEESPIRPAAVIWPENLLTTPLEESTQLAAALQASVVQLGVPVLMGSARAARGPEPGLYRSSVLWLVPGEGIVAALDKTRAVPVVESGTSLPGALSAAWMFGRASAWKKVEEEPETAALRGEFTLTPVLCYEALFPDLVAARRAPDSVAILNLADDSWAGGDMATRQLTAFATFRAIEQRLPLIRVAHGGLSVVVDEFGRTMDELPLDAYASTVAVVSPRPAVTWREKLTILSLPLLSTLGVWWALRRWTGGTRHAP